MALNIWWPRFHKHGTVSVSGQPLVGADTKVFTIGSCFASEIRKHLRGNGLSVAPFVSDECVFPLFHPFAQEGENWGHDGGSAHTQFYNTASIRQVIEDAFLERRVVKEEFWRVRHEGKEIYQNPYLRRCYANTEQDLLTISDAFSDAFERGVRDADVFVLTLGLIESWCDAGSGRTVCVEPWAPLVAGQEAPVLKILDYHENVKNLAATIDVIRAQRPDASIVISVSPVALARTYREMDVLSANTESKSTLRAAVGEICRTYESVIYFPSYEMCLVDPWTFREDDGRHVRREKVNQIMRLFDRAYSADQLAETKAGKVRISPVPTFERFPGESAAVAALRNIKLPPRLHASATEFFDGYEELVKEGTRPERAYYSMRYLYAQGRGIVEDVATSALGTLYPPQPIDDNGILGEEIRTVGRDAILESLKQHGVYLFKNAIPADVVDRLRGALVPGDDCLKRNAGRWDFREEDVIRVPEAVRLATDPGFVAIAQDYLGCQPVFDFVTAWENRAAGMSEADLSTNAMMYHFDKDRLCFLKVFVYLTDVDEDSGPHCFVAGSHVHKPDPLWRDGRIPDAEIEDAYPPENIWRILGDKGTVFVADTHAFHKGIAPRTKNRSIFQIEYANSLFGYDPRLTSTDRPEWSDFLKAASRYGSRFTARFYD